MISLEIATPSVEKNLDTKPPTDNVRPTVEYVMWGEMSFTQKESWFKMSDLYFFDILCKFS